MEFDCLMSVCLSQLVYTNPQHTCTRMDCVKLSTVDLFYMLLCFGDLY